MQEGDFNLLVSLMQLLLSIAKPTMLASFDFFLCKHFQFTPHGCQGIYAIFEFLY